MSYTRSGYIECPLGEQGHGADELIGIDFPVAILVEVLKDEAALAVRALEVGLERHLV